MALGQIFFAEGFLRPRNWVPHKDMKMTPPPPGGLWCLGLAVS